MPLSRKTFHVIESREINAHHLYDECHCKPDFWYDVSNGESIKLVLHVNFNQYPDSKPVTLDEEGAVVKPKPEEVCT